MAVALDSRTFGERSAERVAGGGGEQRLPAAGERHDARGERLGEALDLGAYCSACDVFGNVLAKRDRPDMEADPGAESEVGKRVVVGERVAGRVSRLVEQQEEAVGTSDLAAVVASDEVARAAVVRGPDFRGAGVAEALDQTCAVHDVGKE